MNDEQAFLDALKATPADDTTRLVYADWLDERGEAAKAEYLRLVVGLVPHYATAAPDPPEAARVQALAEQLPREWRTDAAARFTMVFYGCDNAFKIQAIKLIRAATGCGLAEGKRYVEQMPSRFIGCSTLEDAIGHRDRFRQYPRILVEVHPCDQDQLPSPALYQVYAHFALWSWLADSHIPEDAIEAFARFVSQVAGIPADRATELAREGNAVMIADSLEPSQLPRRLAEWQAMLPPPAPDRLWDIELSTSLKGPRVP